MAMNGLRPIVLLVALVAPAACRDQPVSLYDGQWIDIAGIDREPADTCEGTFEYLDAYAGVLAAEYGIDAPLGTYVWYSREEFDTQLPCGDNRPYPWACALDDEVHSPFIPHEHELVHIANFHPGQCPNALSEGLAVYYSSEQEAGRSLDLDVLAAHLAAPSETMPQSDYEMRRRFAAFLVEEYGIQSVLDVCALAGQQASGAQLSEAMLSVLGASPAELLAALGEEPGYCNDFRRYRSKVFSCGVAAAAPSLGIAVDGLEAQLEVGCDRAGTLDAVTGEIRRTWSLNIPASGIYVLFLWDEALDQQTSTSVSLELSRCGVCEDWATITAGPGTEQNAFPLIAQLDPGRYSLEIRLPGEFSGTLRLEIIQ